MSICGLRRLSIHYTPHPPAVLPLCFSAFDVPIRPPAAPRDRTNRRRFRLFPARVTSLSFRFRRPDPPAFSTRRTARAAPERSAKSPAFPFRFRNLSVCFLSCFTISFSFQALRAFQTGARNKKKHARAACFLRCVFLRYALSAYDVRHGRRARVSGRVTASRGSRLSCRPRTARPRRRVRASPC